ncbi:MAG: YlxR family protein [Fimbriimonadales bacterium]
MAHQPIRRCAFCRRTAPKSALLRFVRLPGSNSVLYDPDHRLQGRGAYLCRDVECLKGALKRRSLERGLKIAVPPALLQDLLSRMSASQDESSTQHG